MSFCLLKLKESQLLWHRRSHTGPHIVNPVGQIKVLMSLSPRRCPDSSSPLPQRCKPPSRRPRDAVSGSYVALSKWVPLSQAPVLHLWRVGIHSSNKSNAPCPGELSGLLQRPVQSSLAALDAQLGEGKETHPWGLISSGHTVTEPFSAEAS